MGSGILFTYPQVATLAGLQGVLVYALSSSLPLLVFAAVLRDVLGAAEQGLGGCIIGSVKRAELMQELGIPSQFEILLVLALGKPVEEVEIEPLPADGSVKYWRDALRIPQGPLDVLAQVLESQRVGSGYRLQYKYSEQAFLSA